MYPVNVITSFNVLGEIKPLYVQLEINLRLRQLKVVDQEIVVKTNYSIEYKCKLENDIEIKLAYYFQSHTWKSDIIAI
jgi:hypothetical protein